jgi:hypothetical protein
VNPQAKCRAPRLSCFDSGIDTIFEKVELTTAKAKDLEKPDPDHR